MKKKIFVIISVLLLVLFGVPIIYVSSASNEGYNNVSFDSFSNAVLHMLKTSPLEEDCDKTFYILEDLTKIDNTLMVDANTFGEVTKSKVKLSNNTCEIVRDNNSVLITNEDNSILINNKDITVTTTKPKILNNKFYFPLQDVARSLGYNVLETQNKVILSNPYQTKRLLISSVKSLDDKGAIRKAEGYDNLHIYEYKSEEDCKNAMNYYSSLSYVDWVEVDRIYSVNDEKFLNKEDKFNTTENNASKEELSNKDLDKQINNNESNSDKLEEVNESKDDNLTNIISSVNKQKSTYITWGAEAMGVASYTNYLSKLGTLNTVIVAVLDTGLDSDHEWFSNRVCLGGKNFSTSSSSTSYEYEDVEGHGTHVAGTIVDLTLNNVKILPIKVMNDNGLGATSNIILGINYISNLKNGTVSVSGVSSSYYKNIVTMNLSLGGVGTIGGSNYNAYKVAIERAYNSGVLPVVASGNEGIDVTNTSPANIECAITVSAIGRAGENNFYHPYWSNWGQFIDVCAPGEDIISACVGGGTISKDGTSMASPHIAGVVALLYSSGEYSLQSDGVELVTEIIKKNSIDLGPTGWDNYYGEGLSYVAYSYAELLENDVIFSDTTIEHQNSFNLTLSFNTSGSSIYYTLDGSTPTLDNGIVYSGSILVSNTQIVRARAFIINGGNISAYSKVSSQVFIINNTDINNAYTVSSSGELLSYNGLFSSVTVPSSYKGTTITSIGERAFINANPELVTLPETVTTIGRYGFYGCSNLERVVGQKVTEIGMYAFYFSDSLQKLTDEEFPELEIIDKYAFSNCASLNEINLSNVVLVDYFAFSNNVVTSNNLTSINLPNAKIVGDFAFYGTKNLENIYLPKVETIGTKAFMNCNLVSSINTSLVTTNSASSVNLPNVKYIGIQSFENNSNLQSIILPELILVGSQCFYNCSNLTNVEIPKAKHIASLSFTGTGLVTINLPQVETIGMEAFQNCLSLVSFNAPKLKVVKAEAFYNCKSLESINLPNVISIEREAFARITACQSVTLSASLEYISSVAFDYFSKNCIFYIYGNTPAKQFILNFNSTSGEAIKYQELDANLGMFNYKIENNEVHLIGLNSTPSAELIIPSYIDDLPVTKICTGAFSGCSAILTLNLPNVTTIESNAFYGCNNITSVNLPKIESIGENAFNGCSAITEINIENVSTIGSFAFNNCNSLNKIKLGKNITNIQTKALGYLNGSLISGFSLIGYEGVAQTYARNNNITFHNVFSDLSRFYFNYYNNNGVTEIYISLVDSYTQGGIKIPANYTLGGRTYTISKIGDNAFENCELLTDVFLPSSIKTLGDSAFYNCTNLKNINLDYVTSIGVQCFSRCENLQSVILDNLTQIHAQTFAYCYNLETIRLPKVKIIGDHAFYFCVGLESVICPSLETIQYGGFSNCYKLKNINLNSVVTLGTVENTTNVNSKFTGSVFENCYELGEFVYLSSIKNMGGQLFSGSGVTKVVIGKNFNFYSENISYRPTDSSITIYGYSNTFANTYANRYKYNFVAINQFSLQSSSDLNKSCHKDEDCVLKVNAVGLNLKYQWYLVDGTNETILPNEINSSLKVDTSNIGTYKYYAVVTNWDDKTLTSSTFTVEIIPNFKITLTYNNNRGKIISNVVGNLREGQDVTYIIQAFEGCFVTSVKVDGVLLSNKELQDALINGYTFTNVNNNHELEVNFGINTYTIQIEYGENGEVYNENNELIQSGEIITVEHNSSPLFIFKGNTNYHAEKVIIDGVDNGKQNNFRFTNVKGNHILKVIFDINKYKITLNHNKFGSVITEQSLTDIYDGEDRTFRIEVQEGYYVESVKCNGLIIPVENNTFTISNIHSDINIVVEIKEINPMSQGTKELIIFIGIGVGLVVLIFVPVLMFRKRRR